MSLSGQKKASPFAGNLMPGFSGFELITMRFIRGIINRMKSGGGGAVARPVETS